MNCRDRLKVALLMGCLFGPQLSPARRGEAALGRPAPSRFVVYYGLLDNAALYGYEIVVLDSDFDSTVVRKLDAGRTVLAYLSLGEVNERRAYAEQLDRQGLLLSRNPNWPEAQFVDMRDTRWHRMVLHELVPMILARGFGGLFLDTLDDAAYLEGLDPVRYAGMVDGAVGLVTALRRQFPRLQIMVNRGYALLPRIASEIDMLLGESVHSTFDAITKSYVRVTPDALRWQLDRLNEARRLQPSLRLFSLDYWAPSDVGGIARLYAEASANGFVPYVATIDLSTIVARP